ncbi:hypothetical protein [Niallia sp. FSL R7-0271]|uniref:hypothetical protein n=1 Tax=Niallia sp. FSL R7-0271 TaxID=2921678 RepID=UPI0030F85112
MNKKIITIMACIAIILPLLLAIAMNSEIFSKALGDANGWLGFWGGYLGAIIGAITVFVLTMLQVSIQRQLHKETLDAQIKLNRDTLKESDLRQRQLTMANLRINKIENIIQTIIILNSLNMERYSILFRWNEIKKEIKSIKKDYKRAKTNNKYAEIFNSQMPKHALSNKSFNVKRKIIRRKRIKYNDLILVNEALNISLKELDEIQQKETMKHSEIIACSAKIKAESFLVDLDSGLDEFRIYQNSVIDLFCDKIEQSDTTNFLVLLENSKEETRVKVNDAIRLCQSKLTREVNEFTK